MIKKIQKQKNKTLLFIMPWNQTIHFSLEVPKGPWKLWRGSWFYQGERVEGSPSISLEEGELCSWPREGCAFFLASAFHIRFQRQGLSSRFLLIQLWACEQGMEEDWRTRPGSALWAQHGCPHEGSQGSPAVASAASPWLPLSQLTGFVTCPLEQFSSVVSVVVVLLFLYEGGWTILNTK